MEAIGHAGTAVGILSSEGIVLAAEKKVTSKLLDSTGAEKMYRIDQHMACAVAGITADANILIDYARTNAQQFLYQYQEPTPVEGIPN
jgi:20S proteasome subunit alpha 3